MTWDGNERRSHDELRLVISEAIKDAISSQEACYPHDHKAFVESLLLKEQRKQELWNEVKRKTIVWATISVLGYVAYLAWDGLKHTIVSNKPETHKIHIQ